MTITEALFGPNGSPDAILASEKAAQSDFVTSTKFPKRVSGGSVADLEALGFKFGDAIDDLFVAAELPAGWKKRGSDHDMWSYIDDAEGNERIAVFYKGAFYDRDAFASITRS